jgi:hypothetical protein
MKRLLSIGGGLLFLAAYAGRLSLAETQPEYRDPFWPLGYYGKAAPPGATPQPTPILTRVLTDEELRALALEEAERIRKSLERGGTMKAGGRIFAYIQKQWVTIGDSFQVEVHGNKYRLEISELTEDNIGLTPHRIPVEATP